MVYTIYVIAGPNGKKYVGQTCQPLEHRWRYHKRKALAGAQGCPHLWSAIKKYGVQGFEIHPLWVVDTKAEADQAERTAILMLRSQDPEFGYNLTPGGEGQSRGYQPSEVTRAKLSEAGRGRKMSAKNRELLIAWNTGRDVSQETRRKISLAKKGKPLSDEHKAEIAKALKGREITWGAKISAAQKGRFVSPETRKKMSEATKGIPRAVGKVSGPLNCHTRWHVKRGIVNPTCKLCAAAVSEKVHETEEKT